ncbi:nitroreductase family protein ['Camptotheca acuminata' phytoplasma]|uniref:nitroreductase family protein n=1 Tax='Camptotheca acuminata' phytoplasma TaxID=3239192 RepID=UPI00351AA079
MHIPTVRLFKKNHKISEKEWNEIFDKIRYSPSSFDLQPWRFFVIESKENKEKLKQVVQKNESQLETSSAIVLLCGNKNKQNSAEYIYHNKFLNKEIVHEQKEILIKKIKNYYNKQKNNKIENEIFFESGLIALHFVLEVQNLGYNAGFIGGFDYEKINKLFNISEDYMPIILIAVGKSENENINEKRNKFKLKNEDFAFFL